MNFSHIRISWTLETRQKGHALEHIFGVDVLLDLCILFASLAPMLGKLLIFIGQRFPRDTFVQLLSGNDAVVFMLEMLMSMFIEIS